jgi:hypothetical protein
MVAWGSTRVREYGSTEVGRVLRVDLDGMDCVGGAMSSMGPGWCPAERWRWGSSRGVRAFPPAGSWRDEERAAVQSAKADFANFQRRIHSLRTDARRPRRWPARARPPSAGLCESPGTRPHRTRRRRPTSRRHCRDFNRRGRMPLLYLDPSRAPITSALPHFRTSALPHFRTSALPHFRTSVLPYFRPRQSPAAPAVAGALKSCSGVKSSPGLMKRSLSMAYCRSCSSR